MIRAVIEAKSIDLGDRVSRVQSSSGLLYDLLLQDMSFEDAKNAKMSFVCPAADFFNESCVFSA